MIDVALTENQSEDIFYPTDFEGYELKIICLEDEKNIGALSFALPR
ncbi:hypothetical protein ACT7DO_24330 [Bacillus pacificus]